MHSVLANRLRTAETPSLAAHESSVSPKAVGEVPLTGLSFNLWSLSSVGPDVNGNAINFNSLVNQTWTLVSTPTAILNFDPTDFTINVGPINGTSGFSNSTGGGTFSVALAGSDTDLVLVYTAVSEPGSLTIGLVGLALVAATFRRRLSEVP